MQKEEKSLFTRTSDGCHKFGWIINLLVLGLMFAYFQGEMHSAMQSASDRLTRIESVLDKMLTK